MGKRGRERKKWNTKATPKGAPPIILEGGGARRRPPNINKSEEDSSGRGRWLKSLVLWAATTVGAVLLITLLSSYTTIFTSNLILVDLSTREPPKVQLLDSKVIDGVRWNLIRVQAEIKNHGLKTGYVKSATIKPVGLYMVPQADIVSIDPSPIYPWISRTFSITIRVGTSATQFRQTMWKLTLLDEDDRPFGHFYYKLWDHERSSAPISPANPGAVEVGK